MSSRKETEFTPELEAAFAALDSYGNGSARAALLPIDAEIARTPADRAHHLRIEQRLLAVLAGKASAPAKQFACNRLALIGAARSAAPLARLLADPEIATDARSALEAIADAAAAKAILRQLPRLSGRQKAGAIASLGVMRCRRAVRLIERETKDKDPDVQRAAVRALKVLKGA